MMKTNLIFGIIICTGLITSCSNSDESNQSDVNNVENNELENTPAPSSISTTLMIDAEKTDVWEIASDLGNLEDYFIAVKDTKCTSDEKNGIGATRTCEFLDGGMVDEIVTQWEEGNSFTLRASLSGDTTNPMAAGWFYKYVEGSYSLKEVGDSTEATISIKWEYLDNIEVTDELEARVNEEFNFANLGVANGLKTFAESGAALTDQDRAEFMKQMMVNQPQ